MSTPRSQSNFRKRYLRIAVEAFRDAGVNVARAEIDPTTGKIVVIAGKPDEPASEGKGGSEWDRD
jgi:hypothetical protein